MQFDFLICSERSGSNLMTRILGTHPDICAPFPRHAIRTFALNYYKYGDISKEKNWECLVRDMDRYINGGFSLWQTKVTAEMIFENVKTHSLAGIIRYIYETEATAQHKERVFIKENHADKMLPFTLSYFPDAKYVHVVRDPRDMALTWKEAAVYGGVKTASHVWLENQQGALKNYGFMKELNRSMIVRFEDLISNTEESVMKVCDFLGVTYNPEMLNFYTKDVVMNNTSQDGIGSWADLRKPIIKDNFNRYKTLLSEAEIRYVERLCKDEMEYFGYKREFTSDSDSTELERKMPDEDTVMDAEKAALRQQTMGDFHEIRDSIYDKKLYLNDTDRF
jgi:hypothetical protein